MISQIIVLIILIGLNAYFAAAEIAFITLNDVKVEKQAKDGNKRAKQILKMLKDPSKFLATIQIGITLAGFLSSAFASNTFADKLAPILNSWLPALNIETWHTISIVVITIILSFFTLVFGELVPKRLAMKYYEKISYATIGIIRVISIVTAPFVKFLTMSTNFVSKIFGVSENEEEIVTEEEIKMMVDEGEEKGTIDEDEKKLINNVFEFNDTVASEIMTHRTDIFAIDVSSNVIEELNELDEYKYSRIPVFEETIDNIIGVLYVKDLLKEFATKEEVNIKALVREAYFIPESKPINEIFKDLQINQKHMAIVIDEYGGTAGLLTMEDILEELVGNIFDEYDDEKNDYEKIDENTYLISGSVSLHELKKILDIDIPDGDYDTLSGYILELLGKLPENESDVSVETKDVTYKIESYEDKRIMWVKACKNNEKSINNGKSKE